MKKMIPLFAVILMFVACKKDSVPVTDKNSTQATITDIHEPGKYTSVYIHGQRWMTTNLAVTRYRNGDKIPQVRNKRVWDTLTTGAWCWWGNDSATGAVYGKLYNWYAVNDPRGLAPTGWHIPSDAEWDTLSTHLGGDLVAGGKLKETGTTHWLAPNTKATNSTGFTGLPGGFRANDGPFYSIGFDGFWWSSTEASTNNTWTRSLSYDGGFIFRDNFSKQHGFSVRCIRD